MELIQTHQLRLPLVTQRTRENPGTSMNLFIMITDDERKAKRTLRQAIYSRATFVTINDDMTHFNPNIEQAYQELYETRFPYPSQYELIKRI